MPPGGKRAGAGRKPGNNGLEKEMARGVLRARVFAKMQPLVDAQIENALGIKYLVVREKKTGKFVRVAEARARVKNTEETIEVWEKDPCVQAFTDLMNRSIDKPAETINAEISGQVDVVERLAAGRKRVADARRR